MFGAPSRFAPAGARYAQVDVSARVEGASPHGLVALLFDELLKCLDTLRAAERAGTALAHGGAQARTVSILHALEAGLDHARGGELAANLARVYRQAHRLVATPRGIDRAPALDMARAMLGDIAGAWASIG